MKKTCFGLGIILGILCLIITGCYIEYDPNNITPGEAWGDGTFSDKVEGTGLGYESVIKVVLDIELGNIIAIEVTHKDSPGIGGAFINKVKPLIVKANSFNVIDGMTGATYTRDGLKEAGKAALNQIPGVKL